MPIKENNFLMKEYAMLWIWEGLPFYILLTDYVNLLKSYEWKYWRNRYVMKFFLECASQESALYTQGFQFLGFYELLYWRFSGQSQKLMLINSMYLLHLREYILTKNVFSPRPLSRPQETWLIKRHMGHLKVPTL